MSEIYLINSLSKRKEKFEPITPGKIGMYSCGPTVYDYIHIGNLRAFLLSDLVRRVFEYNGFSVKQIMNITDIGHLSSDADDGEDKMTKGLRREGKPITLEAMLALATFYADKFKENLADLNILPPTVLPRASEHIAEDISLIEKLEKKGFAYRTSDGIYFDTEKDPNYGALEGVREIQTNEARIKANSEKHTFRDFALWKFNPALGYDSPWGKGFPGWHIECSAMSERYLGEHFDIHTGGMDLAPIHHNNEIAQSECAHSHEGKHEPFVNYWLHNAFVNVESGKMAKSEGNSITLASIAERGINPLAYRYWLLGGHYRTPMTFSWSALEAAEQAYWFILGFIRGDIEVFEASLVSGSEQTQQIDSYKRQFLEAINNDLNTSQALAVLHTVINNKSISHTLKKKTLFEFDKVLGLKLNQDQSFKIPDEITKLVAEREQARAEKRWNDADDIRKKIQKLGFDVRDTEKGSVIEKN
jgi:cysteinyl-tRNA synthetase